MTITEVFVALVVLAILSLLLLPFIRELAQPSCPAGAVTVINNAKELHYATQQMALDGQTEGKTNFGWPGDSGGTYKNWVRQLVPDYIGTNEFCKLMSSPGKIVPKGKIPSHEDCVLLVYAVESVSPSNTVFLTSANFTNTPAGGLPLSKNAKPFGNQGFVVFRKAGDGAILQAGQVGQTNIIGGYVPLLK